MAWLFNRQRETIPTTVSNAITHSRGREQFFISGCTMENDNVLNAFLTVFRTHLAGETPAGVSGKRWSRKPENNVPFNFSIPHSPHASVRTTVGRFTLRLGPLQEAWALGNMAASNASWFQLDIRRSILFYLYTTTVQKLRKCQWTVLDNVAALLVHQCYKREWFMYNIPITLFLLLNRDT